MSKKSNRKKHAVKKNHVLSVTIPEVVEPAIMGTIAPEDSCDLSFDQMMNELEAIIHESLACQATEQTA